MKVFVSGAAGFVGGHLAESLAAAGHTVRAIARPSSDTGVLEQIGAEIVHGDLTDATTVQAAVRGCDLVHHVATVRYSDTTDRVARSRITQSEAYRAEILATENIVRASVDAGVEQFVYCSTAAVHARPARLPADETEPVFAETVHRGAKIGSEAVVRTAVEQHGLSAVIARPTQIFGPRDRRVTRFFRLILEGRFSLVGDGSLPFHVTYVDDVVRGLRLCERRRPGDGEAFLLGSDPIPTQLEFFGTIADIAGVPLRRSPWPLALYRAAALAARTLTPLGVRPGIIRDTAFFTTPRAYDTTKAKRQLGFAPQVPLREAIQRTMAWVRSPEHARP